MNRLATLCLFAVSLIGSGTAQAGDGCCKPLGCDRQPCQSSCTMLTCRAEVKTVKVSKTRFKVECDRKCIPAITFPWQKQKSSCNSCYDGGCQGECNTPKCGKVISVNVLSTDKYEVEECVCEWNIEEVPCVVNCCKPSCCDVAAPGGSMLLPSEPEVAPEIAPPPPKSTKLPPLFFTR